MFLIRLKQFLFKLMVYALLLAGSALFIIPLVWMMSTALKPIEQTMSMPPSWLPYQLYAQVNGERVKVTRGELVEQPSLVVFDERLGMDYIVAQSSISEGHLIQRTSEDEELRIPVIVRAEIPGSEERPWMRVIPEVKAETETMEESGGGAAGHYGATWFVVPEDEVEREVSFRWENFGKAIRAMKYFPQYLRNTLILCLLTVVGTVSSSAIAAYGFSRIPWRGRNKVFLIALATMMIPFPVVMVPIYSMGRSRGWIGTLRPWWVGAFCAGAFNVFLLRQFFMTIPKDLSDAARIDGCSEFRIFWQIMLPLCRPSLMVVGLFQFMGTWNDFLGPLIYLTNQKDFTLALGLQFFQSQHGGTEWHYLMAASTLVGIPIIILFFFTQKTFIEGISMTGIKG
jgi:multiple sugar transport system permease protein